jgi:hypothetical protein
MGVATVSLASFRDLVIVIWGLVATIGVIAVVVVVIMCYRQVRPILNSVKSVTRTVETITTCLGQEVAGPLAQVIGFVQGFRRAFGMSNRGKR